jgi:hypothetical protein
MSAGRPMKFESPEKLQELIDAYFKNCDDNDEIYTVTGLAMALDTDRQTLVNYSKREEYFDTIKKAKQKVENQMITRALTGAYNSAVSIFLMKNNFGYVDKTEQEVKVSERTKAEKLSDTLFGDD